MVNGNMKNAYYRPRQLKQRLQAAMAFASEINSATMVALTSKAISVDRDKIDRESVFGRFLSYLRCAKHRGLNRYLMGFLLPLVP
jgi:hypothetical protein